MSLSSDLPQGAGRGNSSGVIRTGGYKDVLARSQRLRVDGTPAWPLRPDDFGRPDVPRLRPVERRVAVQPEQPRPERWYVSLALWLAIIGAVPCIPLIFIALGVGHGW